MRETRPTPQPQVYIGTFIDDRHRIDGVLGEGGFATVYSGVDTITGRAVAIKVLHRETQISDMARTRFEREIEAVSQLKDPRTVRLYSHGETKDARYMVFEQVPGADLSAALEEHGPLAPEIVRHILTQVLTALREAHQAGVLHRDIKPANIRVFESGGDPWSVKLLDFGLARFADPKDARVTKTGELLGTPRYMSPEQLLGEQLGPGSDIYAVGIVAFEMLVGTAELHGHRWGDQLQRLESGYFFAATGEEGTQLYQIIERMTARKLDRRYQSAEAVLRALDRPEIAENAAPAIPDGTARGPETAPSASPIVPIVVGGTTILLLGIVIGVVVAATLGGEPQPPPVQQMVAPPTPQPVAPPFATADVSVADAAADAVDPIAPTGCGRGASWTGDRRFTLTTKGWALSPGVVRHFNVYLPASYDPAHAHPLVMLFQTLLVDGATNMRDSNAAAVADEKGFIVMSFDRVDEGREWAEDDVRFVADALQTTAEEACVDPTQIFAIGQGLGTVFARTLACTARFAAIGALSDVNQPIAHDCKISPPVPFIRIAGRNDPYVPTGGGKNCLGFEMRSLTDVEAKWRDQNGCGDAPREWAKHGNGVCRTWDCDDAPFVSCQVDGGHQWPGATPPPFEFAKCLNSPTTFPVIETIWDFFEEQTTRPAVTK